MSYFEQLFSLEGKIGVVTGVSRGLGCIQLHYRPGLLCGWELGG